VILTLPDDPALADMSESDIRLDLACALYAAGRVSRGVACRIAGMQRIDFDQELIRRRIPGYTEEMLDDDIASLSRIFPK
jgi:predicted HTH domain antitoxin